jgi:predicted O-methyltransferase YrrM
VDADRFLRHLPALFRSFPDGEEPLDPRFAEILEAVPGLTRANNLALLNLAARCLGPGETYVEVGTFRGTSLIAAMLDNEGGDFVAIDDFSHGDGSREQLERNLAGFGLDGRAAILEGDAFELLRDGALAGRRLGAYYYDAAHTYEQQRDGLVRAEPYLVPGALLVVDDTDWDFVAAAVRDYLAARPNVRSVVEIGGKDTGRAWWWEGVRVLEWRAAAA